MKALELRELQIDELTARLLDVERDFFKLRSRREVERISDRSGVMKMRRDIARIKTVIREKQLNDEAQRKESQA